MKHILLSLSILYISAPISAQQKSDIPNRHVLSFHEEEREYFIQYPQNIDPDKTYWLLVVVHGGGGNGRSYWLADGIKEAMTDHPIDYIIVTPSFSNIDVQASRFPQLGEGAFLIKVMEGLKDAYRVHDKILLTGYSRGGQFTHRFALQHPELVKACASFSAGTWTTPDGKLLMESIDIINDPASFLSDTTKASLAPERLNGMFNSRVAKVAGWPAKESAQNVPFLIMCGTRDSRFEIAQSFANSLKTNGFQVLTGWPETPHKERDKYPEEFRKYVMTALNFFSNEVEK